MRFALLLFVTAIVASPFPANDDVAVAAATSSGAVTKTRHHNHHKEPTPTFKLACNCKKPIIPAGQMNAKELCQYKYFLDIACFHQAQGGCASPTLTC